MTKLTEFNPGDEEEIVNRILYRVHKAIDENFPHAVRLNDGGDRLEFGGLGAEDTVVDFRARHDSDKTDPNLQVGGLPQNARGVGGGEVTGHPEFQVSGEHLLGDSAIQALRSKPNVATRMLYLFFTILTLAAICTFLIAQFLLD